MEPKINQIHSLLIKTNKTIAIAESCTGGMLSEFLTHFSGSSKYFLLGIIVYSNKAKETILGIPKLILAKHGAVSQETAQRMAQRVRILGKADFGIGITGIAGPSGGTKEKPLGTVFISINTKSRQLCKKFIFKGNRAAIRKQAALKSLELIRNFLI